MFRTSWLHSFVSKTVQVKPVEGVGSHSACKLPASYEAILLPFRRAVRSAQEDGAQSGVEDGGQRPVGTAAEATATV